MLSLFMQFVKISHVAASIVLLLDLYHAIDFAQKPKQMSASFVGVFGT